MQYRPLLGDLKFTLDSLRPRIIQQIGDHNVQLGLPNDEIEGLQRQMEEGIELVRKLSHVGMWNCNIWCSCCNCTKPSYTDQLVELDRSLRILLEILKLQEARDVKEALLLARKIHDKQDELDKKMSDLLIVQQEAGLTAQHETTVGELSASNTQTMVQDRVEGNSVQGAALGAAFSVLFGAVIQVKDNTRMFKRVLGYLKSTLDSLKPLIEEVAKCNRVLHLPKEELENFRIEMEKGVELVVKCSKVHRWASYKKYEYSNKLLGLDESLQRLLHILRVQLARDVRESLVSVSNMEKVIEHIAGHDVVQNDEVAGKGLCPLPEPTSTTVGLDVLNVHERGDVIKEASVAARKIVEGVKLIEGSGVLKDQNGIKGLYEVVEPPSPKVGLDVLNLQGTINVEETSDSTTNMEAGVKQIEESGVVKNQIDIAVTEPQSLRDGLEVANMQGTRDDQQIQGIGAVALQAPVSVYELPSLNDSSFQFGLLDSMSSFEDNQQVIDWQQQQNSLAEALNFNKYFNLPTEKAGLESEIEFEPESRPGFCPDILTGIAYLRSRQHDDASEPDYIHRTQSSQHVSQLKSDDGFNWRKYGQRQVEGSKYPRSYYKCTYHNCPTKKKVERSLNGEITEIVYKGSHNHPKPQSTRQSTSRPIQGSSYGLSDQLAPKISNPKVESAKMPDDLEQNSPISNSGVQDENEPVAKEWDVGNANDQTTHTFSASGSSIVKEPRTVVQTVSEIDLVDDGYRWRKYGQKVMKGNFLPRAYYKCTYTGCPVRKHVERSPHDSRSVITTYEGKHNHDVPAARYSDIYSAPKESASEYQSQSLLGGLDVLDVHATEDAIKKTLVESEQELLNEGNVVVQDQIAIKGYCEGIEPPLFAVGLDGQGPMDVKETSDSTVWRH
ncbi:uncharacterized protein LOC103949291 isoform X2 [Pyrus x bretschneideri]|nr:uncharacterized protein LOC103949291 isoform X2 [Pyrus x bretschneideri]